MHFRRPREPEGFAASTHEARLLVERCVASNQEPKFDEQLWQRHKGAFATAQKGKCAYCEMKTANHDADVDHYAPKAEVWEPSADEKDRGREIALGLPNIRGRKPARTARGYYWRAYEWSNYLLVCSACNRKWKRCYFPVDASPRAWPPGRDSRESALLLDPFEDREPWRHFRFDEFGKVTPTPGSKRGRATIVTCGLDGRESLRDARAGHATDAYRHARAIASLMVTVHSEPVTPDDRGAFRLALESLYELGGKTRAHAGMVRSIAEEVIGIGWVELRALHDRWCTMASGSL